MTDCIHELPKRTCSICQSRSSFRSAVPKVANSFIDRAKPLSMSARRGSLCLFCDERISEGDLISNLAGEWVHAECAE